MTDENKALLANNGMNVDDALGRFMGNEAILDRLLKKFLEDKTLSTLKKAIEDEDVDAAFTASHTMKGVAANFSFTELQAVASIQCEEFRAKNFDKGAAYLPEVIAEYDKICAVINKIYGGE